MKWITREKVKVDRVACPWLIRKFVDPSAEFIFGPADQVAAHENLKARTKAFALEVVCFQSGGAAQCSRHAKPSGE